MWAPRCCAARAGRQKLGAGSWTVTPPAPCPYVCPPHVHACLPARTPACPHARTPPPAVQASVRCGRLRWRRLCPQAAHGDARARRGVRWVLAGAWAGGSFSSVAAPPSLRCAGRSQQGVIEALSHKGRPCRTREALSHRERCVCYLRRAHAPPTSRLGVTPPSGQTVAGTAQSWTLATHFC